MMEDGNSKIPLRDVLQRMACQIQELATAGAAIEEKVGDEIRHGPGLGKRLKLSLQGLDHLVQTLGELGLFLERVAPDIAEEVTIDPQAAAHRIRLRELSQALLGQSIVRAPVERENVSGEVDMF